MPHRLIPALPHGQGLAVLGQSGLLGLEPPLLLCQGVEILLGRLGQQSL